MVVVRGYFKLINGIVIISDVCFVGVVKVCEILGLLIEFFEVYEIVVDKGWIRFFEMVGIEESFVLRYKDDFEGVLV